MSVYRRFVWPLLLMLALPLPLRAQGGPPSISFADAADLAAAASGELRNEYAQRAIKERSWRWGRRVYFPRLSLTASEDDRLSETGSDSFLKNYGVSIDQLLWDGGRTAMGRRIERAELNLLDHQLTRMAGEIAEAAVAAYRKVLSSRAVLEIREASWEFLGEQRRILSREVELGLALPADLIEAEIRLTEARLEILSLRIDSAEAERQLAEVLGLEVLPVLAERVEVRQGMGLPSPETVRSLAEGRNPDLIAFRYSIARKEEELRYASRSWVPTVRINGGFNLSGRQYPLTRHNWSVGLSIDFSSPFFTANLGASAGWEPPYDRNARTQTTVTPLPDPGAALNVRSAKQSLILEKTKYGTAFERTGRLALAAVEKCSLTDRKRALAVESLDLSAERFRLAELRLELGQITRLDLMKARLEHTQREIGAVEAAAALLEARRELERLLDLRPGELSALAGGTGGGLEGFAEPGRVNF